MDAEVSGPRSMEEVRGGSSSSSRISGAELEVLKLQELVRKLERQNEQLRSRANAAACGGGGGGGGSPGPAGPQQLVLGGPLLHASLAALRDDFPAKKMGGPPVSVPVPVGARSPGDEPFAYFQPSSASPEAADEEDEAAAEEDGGAPSSPGSGSVLDEVEVLDLGSVLPVLEPDSWLYVGHKAKQQADSILTPLQWCRQVLDHPGPEVALAKMNLCHRLDQARRWRSVSSVRPYSCMDGLSTLSCPVLPYSKSAALTDSTGPLSSPGLLSSPGGGGGQSFPGLLSSPGGQSFPGPSFLPPSLPLRSSCSLSDRAPTFLSNSALHNVGRRHAAISPQSSLDSEVGVSELEDDSISMSYKLQDMTDVEVMARLQEESLRQDYASTSATASRRSSSFSLHSLRRSSEMDLEEEDEDEDEGYDQLPPPQPQLFRSGSVQHRGGGGLPHSHTFSSIRDVRRITSTSTAAAAAPHFSLSGLSHFSSGLSSEPPTGFRSSADKLRRSMPNLIRAPSMPSVPSVPCLASSPVTPPPSSSFSHGPSSLPTISSLRSSLSFDSSSGLARLQSALPSPGQLSQRVQSVSNFPTAPRHPLKATAYVSPTVQQGPAPSAPLTSSVSLHSVPGSAALPQPLKPAANSLVPQPLKAAAPPRSSLPRPASFVGTSGVPRPSKIAPPTRSLLTPPKSLAALSALRDGSWKDGCY